MSYKRVTLLVQSERVIIDSQIYLCLQRTNSSGIDERARRWQIQEEISQETTSLIQL